LDDRGPEKYAARPEALRVPLVFLGQGVEELNRGGRWSEVDIALTMLGILNISSNLSAEGKSLPIHAGFDLLVTGARPRAQELWQGAQDPGYHAKAESRRSCDDWNIFRRKAIERYRGQHTLHGTCP